MIKQFNKEEQEYKTSFKKRQKLRRQADIAKAKAEKAAQQAKAANADTDQNVTSPTVDEDDPIALEKAEKERKAKEEKEKLEKEEAAVLAGKNDGHTFCGGWMLSPNLNIRLCHCFCVAFAFFP